MMLIPPALFMGNLNKCLAKCRNHWEYVQIQYLLKRFRSTGQIGREDAR